MQSINKLAMICLLLFALVGCSMNKQNATDTTTNNATSTENATDLNEQNANQGERNDMDTQIDLADDAADRLVALDEVESANVLVTNQNAYVGVMLKEGVEETNALTDKIATEVRQTNAEFTNVYVSTNPDVVGQLQDYGDKIRAGEPVEGFFEEFTDAIARMFPNAK